MIQRNSSNTATGLTMEALGWAAEGFKLTVNADPGEQRRATLMRRSMAEHRLLSTVAELDGESVEPYWLPDDDAWFVRMAIITYKNRKLSPLVTTLKKASDPEDALGKVRMDNLKQNKPAELDRLEILLIELARVNPDGPIVLPQAQ